VGQHVDGAQVNDIVKTIKEIALQLLIALLASPVAWIITAIYSEAISEMLTSFDATWYRHYWSIVAVAFGLGALQLVVLLFGTRTFGILVLSLFVWIAMLSVYTWKQLAGPDFPYDWPIVVFFLIFCAVASQLVAIVIFVAVVIAMKLVDLSKLVRPQA
jgi:hypothetical protein